MRGLMLKLWNDDARIVALEYLILGTFLALFLIVGVNALAKSINTELAELGNAILAFDQSYSVSGYSMCGASKGGSQAIDTPGLLSSPSFTPPIPSVINVNSCP